MIARYRDGAVPDVELDPALAADFDGLAERGLPSCSTRAELTRRSTTIWQRVRRLNRYVEEQAPWELAKDEAQGGRARRRRSRSLAEGLRVVDRAAAPVAPETAEKLLDALGASDARLDAARRSGAGPARATVEQARRRCSPSRASPSA